MQKTLIGIVIAVIVGVGGYIAYRVIGSRSLSPEKTITYNYNGLDLKLTYCRPSKRGRLIFGDSLAGALVPLDKYWRLGANGATEITLSKDVNVAGKPLKAGSYRVYAVPRRSSWEISFNSELGKWGYDEPDYSKDVLKIEVPVEQSRSETELFTIGFSHEPSAVNMSIDWDKVHLKIPISLQQ